MASDSAWGRRKVGTTTENSIDTGWRFAGEWVHNLGASCQTVLPFEGLLWSLAGSSRKGDRPIRISSNESSLRESHRPVDEGCALDDGPNLNLPTEAKQKTCCARR